MRFVTAVADFVKREPALLATAAGDAIGIGTDFGLHLTAAQQRDLFGAVSFVTAVLIRQAVTPNVRVPKLPDLLAPGLTVDQRLARLEAAVSELAAPTPTISK